MKLKVHYIGSGLQEMSTDEINTGTMTTKVAIEQASDLLSAAEDILWNIGMREHSDQCAKIYHDLDES